MENVLILTGERLGEIVLKQTQRTRIVIVSAGFVGVPTLRCEESCPNYDCLTECAIKSPACHFRKERIIVLPFQTSPQSTFTMPIKFASFFQQQQTVIIPSIDKTESTDSTIDAKGGKVKTVPRRVTRSPSPPQEPVQTGSIWRSLPSVSYQSSGNSSDEDSVPDMWTIRRCNAFEEDSDEEDC